jgi:vacuolar-type H+-ATPase subunit E/Vma4
VKVNEKIFLDTIDKDRFWFIYFSIGGVIASAARGKIVCNNTLKNRIQLSF